MKPHHVDCFNRGWKEGFYTGIFTVLILFAAIVMFGHLVGCKTVEPTPQTNNGDPEIWQPAQRAQPVEAY